MVDKGIEALEPKIDGRVVGRITCVDKKRRKPTVKAIYTTLLENVFENNDTKYNAFMEFALKKCDATAPTIRRTRPKASPIVDIT